MKIIVQLIENYLKQGIPTIILTIEKNKYLFNFPSCFQRFIKDHRQKFPKGSHIFFTKTTTDTLAGLSGFLLTIFESKICQDTKLYVSDELYHYLEQVRYKMGFKILPYSYSNLFSKETRTGIREVSQVYELLSHPDYASIFMNSQSYIRENLRENETNRSRDYLNQDNEFSNNEIRIIPIPIEANGEKLINYILIPNKLEGRVLANKAKQLKVPPKLMSKLLADGQIILEDGTRVTADQIKEPDSPSPNVLILHFNSIEAVDQLLAHPRFLAYQKDPENITNSVIHIVEQGEPILQSQQFQILMKSFPLQVKHIVYNRNYCNKDYDIRKEPVSRHIELVSFVHKHYPTFMPDILRMYHQSLDKTLASATCLEDLFPERKVISYRRCHELVLAPKKSQGYIAMGEGQMEKQKQKREFVELEGMDEEVNIDESVPQIYNNFEQVNPKVVFLGTGSMKPSKYRNVSSIYVEMTPQHSILLDCGEGSYYQLFNHFGLEEIDQVTLRTRIIFITHIHSDHNLGILDFIAERNKLLRAKYNKSGCSSDQEYQQKIKNDKLFLIFPYNVLPWFHSFVSNIENLLEGCDILFVQTLNGEPFDLSNATVSKDERKTCPVASEMKEEKQENDADNQACEQPNEELEAYFSPLMKELHSLYNPAQAEIHERFKQYLDSMGVINFEPIHVDHCPQSFAVVIEHKSRVKISYSGDCRPSEQFAKAANESTLLIHEATFGDDLVNNAVENMHSTVGEAIDIALKSKSWKLALTHFSQRYISAKQIVNPSIYKLDEEKRNYAEKHSVVCFDHLRMRMSELPLLTYQSRRICEIFPSDSQE